MKGYKYDVRLNLIDLNDNMDIGNEINNPNYGRKVSDEQKRNHSKFMNGRYVGELNGNWKGGISNNRDHVLSEKDCIKLNKRFKGSEMHHITQSIGIYIPKELHRHISHNLKNGRNIGEINMLSLQFINGGYDE